uniref:Regulatory protein n=1 Tax=uncultured virus TaxID=340016 RepID=D5L2K5_9VIRU|nr:regulatory protein [uncultured virus]
MTDAEPRYRDEEWLREQYLERGQTMREIADMCGCSQTTVSKWINRHGIETRSGSDYWGWGRLGVRIS